MQCATENKQIKIWLPLTTPTGKIRAKRPVPKSISEPLPTRSRPIKTGDYLEWQISYETKNAQTDNSVLGNIKIKKDKKIKFPFELAWLLKKSCDLNLLGTQDLKKIKFFIDSDNTIFIETVDRISFSESQEVVPMIKNLGFTKKSVIAPLYQKQAKDYFIEIMISKRQYAVGVQAMIYVGIPLEKCFSDIDNQHPLGRIAKSKEKIYYYIGNHNISLIEDCIIAFAIASPRHRKDLRDILSALNL